MIRWFWKLLGWRYYTIRTCTMWVRGEHNGPQEVSRLKHAMLTGEIENVDLKLIIRCTTLTK